ncbi:hypothetical protein ACFRJ1_15995 [Streptomyces sp. NPDC056773]|uniref:hypothetical protein n=1 Tax=unclassified Streptomyces TaxID=2593676 RepID=UPI0036A9CC81
MSPLVPVAQLYARDVPDLRPPGRADLLQVLWCPSEHPPFLKPTIQLFWRTAADVSSSVLTSPPTPADVQYGYMPKPCVLSPEQVTEYPNFLELSQELRAKVNDWSTWRAVGIVMDDAYEEPQEYYSDELSEAPGWKVGGWPPWGLTDPAARFCINCGTVMAPLLTIASNESRDYRRGWVPTEDQGIAVIDGDPVRNPPGIQVSKGNHLQLYSCRMCSHHTTLIQ